MDTNSNEEAYFSSSEWQETTQVYNLWNKLFTKNQFAEASPRSSWGTKSHKCTPCEGKKSYKCLLCETSFSKKNPNLKKYLLEIHGGKKSHKCSHCEKSFSQKGNWNSHIVAVHEGKKSYKSLQVFTLWHKLFTTRMKGKKSYQCSLCEKKVLTNWHFEFA